MSTTAFNHLFTLLKFSVGGLVLGVIVVMIVFLVAGGASSLTSNNSSFLGTEKQWAQIMLEWLLLRGALCGLAIGLVVGLVRIAVLSRRR